MKRFLTVVAAVVFLSTTAWAGDIPTADYTPPPPPPQSSIQTSGANPGDIPTADSTASTEIQQIIINALLSLLP